MNIKTFGPVDDRSRKQLETCMKAGDAEFGVLCADHHPGYSQPIGGGIAYEAYVSPSGVGYDIGCLGGDARVSLADCSSLPLNHVRDSDAALCWDGHGIRPIAPNLGGVPRGQAELVRIVLSNGRELLATPDHEVRVKLGWRHAGELAPGEKVACLPHVGRRRETRVGRVPIPEPATPGGRVYGGTRADRLARRGLWPLRWEDPRLPALVRLLAYNCGDGSLASDGKRVSFWTTVATDAETIRRDADVLGFEASLHRRPRAGGKDELHVYIGSVELHSMFAVLGVPIGPKRWERRPMRWLFDAPAWLRANFLSSFASAEGTTPRLVDGRICNLAIKQAGENANAATFVAELLRSLGLPASDPAPSGPARGSRQTWLVQLLGGEEEQLRFLEDVGFCYAANKRVAAAIVASVAWQRRAELRRRRAAWTEARRVRAAGAAPWRAQMKAIADRFDVPSGFVYHAYDAGRGQLRSAQGAVFTADHSGEIAWVEVERVEEAETQPVWDLATADVAGSFIAEGVVVHNCGNKAVETNLTRADIDDAGGVEPLMKEIAKRIAFGMGVPAHERADHEVLEHIRDAPFEPQRKLLGLAEKQLGTVGSGNHYVNLFEDERGTLWVGVHFGSRGFGHKTASGFLAVAQGLPFDEGERKRLGLKVSEGEMDSPPVLLRIDSEAGQAYIEAMSLAGEYAYAGRDVVVDKVLEILGAEAVHEVHNHHNFAWLEEHFGRRVWVVRKGCTPALPGQEGFVGGSMGEDSVILEGAEAPESKDALYSTVHGAGRVMSRSQAAGRVKRRTVYECGERDCAFAVPAKAYEGETCPDHPDRKMRKVRTEQLVRPGVVDWPAVQERLRKQGIVLVGGGADEAPEVYKRLPDVLSAHGDSIRVKHTLTPLGVAMAGRDVFDPYKD